MIDVKQQLKVYAERAMEYTNARINEAEQESKAMALEQLYGAMRHSLNAGGKRVRPALVYAFCKAVGGELSMADSAASATEMSHTASLIFDDLPALDNDDLRRGKPSCHKAFGESTAILAGIGLVVAPFQFMCEDPLLSDAQKAALSGILARRCGVVGLIGGELKDMDIKSLDMQFLHQCYEGETISIRKREAAEGFEIGILSGEGVLAFAAAVK